MHVLDLTIKEIHEALVNKEITVLELTKEALRRAKEDKNNAFETICEEEALKRATELDSKGIEKENLLYGIPFVAKDNFSTKDIETTASSNILVGYKPLFDATVISKLYDKGMVLIGKATLDELALGGTGTSGHKGITYNPYDLSRTHLVGGSSCGSAASVAAGIVPFALGSDTGDSVRKPASYAGLFGFKPTWGRISRFGLFPFAPSMDHVAYFTRNSFDAALILEALSGHDFKDSTSSEKPVEKYSEFENDSIKGKTFAVIDELISTFKDKEILAKYHEILTKIQEKGGIIKHYSIPEDLLKAIYGVYVVISCAEATSNNANLDGIKFGPYRGGNTYQEVMTKARTEGFSALIKRRFVIGSYALMSENQKELFLRAQRARHMIVDKFNEILKDADVIIAPASPTAAPKINGASDKLSSNYLVADNYLAFANFGGQPSFTIPLGFNNEKLPYGLSLTSGIFEEKKLLNIANDIEKLTGLTNLNVSLLKEGK